MSRLYSIKFKKAYKHKQRKNKKECERVYEKTFQGTFNLNSGAQGSKT